MVQIADEAVLERYFKKKWVAFELIFKLWVEIYQETDS